MQKSIQIAYNELFEKKCALAAAAGFHYIAVDFTQIEDTTEYAWNVHTENIQRILEKNGKLYTQIKIDEINNLGVVKIRLRSMTAAILEQRRGRENEK